MNKLNIKEFNTTGPCIPDEHYMLPVLPRIHGIDRMINKKYYFVIHAPRQSGKTTFLKALTKSINSEGNYYALYCSLEFLEGITDLDQAMSVINSQIIDDLKVSKVDDIKKFGNEYVEPSDSTYDTKFRTLLRSLCNKCQKDIVIFFDEADCISGQPFISFLRQIRIGHNNRSDDEMTKFPRCIALVGLRDIKDYLVQARSGERSKGTGNPFNIKKRVFTIPNFTKDEISTLYHQHTEASGQVFELEAVERAWYWSEGQPWLVNALADEVVVEILNENFSIPITGILIDQAALRLINSRVTHIDYLRERLKEPRVAKVMDSVFASSKKHIPSANDDRQYCIDLGLVVLNETKKLRPANAIYKEVMSRSLLGIRDLPYIGVI